METLRIDELSFRIVCGMIAEDVRWTQVSSVLVAVDASPSLSAMVADLGIRVKTFCDTGGVAVDGDEEFMFTRDDDGHPAPNVDAPKLGVYIEFVWAPYLRLDAFRFATRHGRRPTPRDKALGNPVLR